MWLEGLLDAYIAMIPQAPRAETLMCFAGGLSGLGIGSYASVAGLVEFLGSGGCLSCREREELG